ncbi:MULTISPECIES: LacI family DNA-binding transcriptional regulator [unclassified Rhodococcus (in: high G+C Gram-positive bacteria)]|uniref:LacI family DNA-binding transcriptional regulator n=1 Tax=unclassified Rhodococcus (in: high G+C Gram-positive bacteria) TaxID=192944 RepID=UPI001F250381|nr:MULTISPECIES: LacI family DNA-binding transcriptional regulator [unclassified Rhodococcus (in: high G+C Gram-positive bacteria)]
MKDVARHANVSVSTVSYVLNDSGPVAPARRARVLDAVRVLNYAPNEAARGLKRRSAPTIGLVVPELSNQFFALLAEGVEQVAAAYGVLVVLCAPEATDGAESLNGRLLRSQRLNGIIYLSGASTSPTSLLELTRLGPIVLVDEQVPGFDVPAVVSNNRRGAREVAQHVLEAGHRNIAVIGGPEGLWTAQQRLAGYREALAAAGIDPDSVPVFCGNYRQNSGTELAAKALSGPSEKRPTALLCANDLMAIGVLEYCRTEGIQVPEELSVVGFDDLPLVSLLTPRLTTVRQPARDMGERAARVLFDLIDGKDDLETPQPFPALLQIRDSVATPRGSS